MSKPKIIAVVGPTASGKSSLGVYLAQKLGGEIISADSRQVYKGLNIATGKVTKREMLGVPHYLLDVASPKKQFSVDDFVKLGEKTCSLIRANRRIPIVVGGTGLYIDALLGRISFPSVPPNLALRARLEKKSAAQLLSMLTKLDPSRAETVEQKNPRRLIRAIEIAKAIGTTPPAKTEQKYDLLWLGLNPSEKILKQNIHIRLFARISRGMVAEARQLHKAGLSYKRMNELGLEYRSLAKFLRKQPRRKVGVPTKASGNKISLTQLKDEIEKGNWEYAKRQMRWFKRNPDIHWIQNKSEALRLAKSFLSS